MKSKIFFLAVALLTALCSPLTLTAQTGALTISTASATRGEITENIKIPSGKSLTVKAGGSIDASDGTINVATVAPGDNSTKAASTAFVSAALAPELKSANFTAQAGRSYIITEALTVTLTDSATIGDVIILRTPAGGSFEYFFTVIDPVGGNGGSIYSVPGGQEVVAIFSDTGWNLNYYLNSSNGPILRQYGGGAELQNYRGFSTDLGSGDSGIISGVYLDDGVVSLQAFNANDYVSNTLKIYAYGNGGRTVAEGGLLVRGPVNSYIEQGLGYAPDTGVGGAVTQTVSRTTGVTLNYCSGTIKLVSAAGSTAWQSFTVSCDLCFQYDTPIVVQKSGTDIYEIHVTAVAEGSFRITYRTTGGTTTEQPVFNFTLIRGTNN